MPGSFSPAKSIFTGFTRLPGLSADKRYGLRTRALLLVAVATMYAKNMPWYGKSTTEESKTARCWINPLVLLL